MIENNKVKGSPRQRHSTLVRRTEIIEAAKKIIVKFGSEHVTIKRLASEVGISQGAIYRHFRSKTDILSLLMEHIRDDMRTDVERGLEDSVGRPSIMGTLDRIMRAHLSSVAQRKGISFLVIAEVVSWGDAKLNAQTAGVIDQYTSRIREMLAEGVACGEVRKDVDLDAASIMLFGIMQVLVTTWTLKGRRFNLLERYLSLWNGFRCYVEAR